MVSKDESRFRELHLGRRTEMMPVRWPADRAVSVLAGCRAKSSRDAGSRAHAGSPFGNLRPCWPFVPRTLSAGSEPPATQCRLLLSLFRSKRDSGLVIISMLMLWFPVNPDALVGSRRGSCRWVCCRDPDSLRVKKHRTLGPRTQSLFSRLPVCLGGVALPVRPLPITPLSLGT